MGIRQDRIATTAQGVPVEQLFFYPEPANDAQSAPRHNEPPRTSNSQPAQASGDRRTPPVRAVWVALLSAIALLVLVFTLLTWLDPANGVEQASQRSEPPAAGQRAPQGSPQPEAIASNSEPVAPIDESQNGAASRVPNAATHPQSPTSPRPTAPTPAKPKKESVLGSVLAPPPA